MFSALGSKDLVRSIHFYEAVLPGRLGIPVQARGAVVFGAGVTSCRSSVLYIVPPVVELELLYQSLSSLHSKKLKALLNFKKFYREEVVDLLERYCSSGNPLPDIFLEGLATIEGLTPFQKACYEQTSAIPHGQTRSYAWLATKIGKPLAMRAVGNAMMQNPFPLFIPCHRVLRKNGDLGGYMGATAAEAWQVTLKKTFLELENSHQQPSLFPLDNFTRKKQKKIKDESSRIFTLSS